MRSTFPVDVFGSGSVTIAMDPGISVRASLPIRCLRSVMPLNLLSGSLRTTAWSLLPAISSGTGMTATSITSGCSWIACSTTCVLTRTPRTFT